MTSPLPGEQPVRLAVLTDNGFVPRFGLAAIDALPCSDITVVSCLNTRHRRILARHGAYYALNLLTIRNERTALVPVERASAPIRETIAFDAIYDGAWQVLPEDIVRRLSQGGFDLVLKLGMGLLRVPPPGRLAIPILSYHHGDPDRFRGRPAGFWETVEGCPTMGQVVQVLSNELDAGPVVAFGETRVHRHSYRATLKEAYSHSPLLMPEALRNVRSGAFIEKERSGWNYRLPSNATVARLVLRMAGVWLRRLAYAALFEKAWRVSTVPRPADAAAQLARGAFPEGPWSTFPLQRPFTFYADPFPSDDPPGMLAEAMNGRTGLGEIVLLDETGARRVSGRARHFSYPATVAWRGRQFVVPEICEWSPPQIFAVEGGELVPVAPLDVAGQPRIVDPTPFEHEGRIYLFGNVPGSGGMALRLWHSDALNGRFEEHPMSPVRISPRGSRMAGKPLVEAGRILRFGQDLARAYGDGIVIFEIDQLGPNTYREHVVSELSFGSRRGPHTINMDSERILFDLYDERMSPLAGVRRLIGRMRRS